MGTPFKMKGISPLKDEKHKGKKGTKGNISTRTDDPSFRGYAMLTGKLKKKKNILQSFTDFLKKPKSN
jgi:hypothetical protein